MLVLNTNKLIRLLFFWVIITVYLFSAGDSYSITWVAYILFSAVSFFAIISKGGKIRFYREVWLFILFVIYAGLSLLWAKYDKNQSLSFLLMMIVFIILSCNVFRTKEDVEFLIKANIWAGVILSIYAPFTYGFNNYINAMISGMRMGSEVGGANTVGICTAMSLVMALGYYLFKRNKLYIAAMAPMVFTCFSTGSRMALITVIAGVLIMFFIYYNMTNRNKLGSFFKIVFFSIVILVAGYYLLKSIPAFNRLYVRFDELIQVLLGNKASTDGIGTNRIRTVLINTGLNAFKENPIFGIGYNNGRYLMSGYRGNATYSLHNNFVDILCGGGIIGFTIYYSLFIALIISLLKRIKLKSWVAGIALATLILNLISHMSGIFHVLKFYYPWLIIWIIAANLPDEEIENIVSPDRIGEKT